MGLCLRDSVYCNGTVECPDASDEPPDCHSKLFFAFNVSLSYLHTYFLLRTERTTTGVLESLKWNIYEVSC